MKGPLGAGGPPRAADQGGTAAAAPTPIDDPEAHDPTARLSAINPPPRPEDEGGARRRRLEWLIGGRLVVTTIFLGGTVLFGIAQGHAFGDFTPRWLIGLIAATYAASLAFAVALERGAPHTPLVTAQVAWDLLLTTGLVYASGGLGSVFTFLYGIVVLLAALTAGPRAALFTSVAAAAIELLGGIPVANGWVPQPPDQPAFRYVLGTDDTALLVMSNLVGLALVAVLSGSLAARLHRTGGALRLATASAAHLAMLNDDIVRSLASGLMTTDLTGAIRTVNPAGAAMLGAPARALLGTRITDVLPVPDARPDGAAARGEGEARRADGTTFPVGFTVNGLVGADGLVTGLLVSFQDLTEIRDLRAQAERAERLATLGRLAAGLAHEIRNPLSSIRGSVELVRDSPALEEEERRLLAIVGSEVARLNELVDTMLQVGRPRTPERHPTDLAVVAQDVVAMAAQGPGGRHVRLETELGEVPRVEVDPHQIRQVLWNLLKNAIQVSPRDGRVTVRLAADGELDAVCLEVADEGPGLAPDELVRVFDAFYSRRPHGIGLGLALVEQIVQAHRGRVEVESAPGRGATFRVVLPAAGTAAAPITRSEGPSPRPDTTSAPAATPRRSGDSGGASRASGASTRRR